MCEGSETANRLAGLPAREDCTDNADFIRTSITQLDRDRKRRDPATDEEMSNLLFRLFCAGRHDIALGRLFEGHVDAWQLLHRYGDRDRIDALQRERGSNTVLGVWNAEGPGYTLNQSGSGISGGKSFASGAGILTHALVTSDAGTSQAQLHLVDLEKNPGDIDDTWWRVAGMRHSETHRIQWTDAQSVLIGKCGDYEREPWFSAGALRFATVQIGGLAGLLDAVWHHLTTLNRAEDIVQQRRLAVIHGEASAAAALILSVGRRWILDGDRFDTTYVANVRNVVYAACERGIALAQQSCGTAAYFEDSPVCRFAQDLGMYIRQPGPDAQMAKVGAAVAGRSLDVWPCAP